MTRVAHTACALVLLAAARGDAQRADTLPRPTLRAAPRSQPIRIDGQMMEAAWQSAEVASDFSQIEPEPNAPASQRSEVRVLVDEGSLYIGARLHDTRPDSIAAQLGRRDPRNIYADVFHVLIDSYFDRRTAFRFSVTASGVQGDGVFANDNDEDDSWDAVWESATSIDSAGWTAELRVPLSQLRFGAVPPGTTRRWGINFAREIARRGETAVWSPIPPTQSGIVSRCGDLVGIDALGTPDRFEILPYVSTQLRRIPSGEANPLVDATRASARIGADLRYGLPRGLTLSATINPDFGQVEVDPAVVNLTAFETFFPERRPFFLEGADIFRFGGTVTFNDHDPPRPFYSRRIGRSPRGSVDRGDAEYVDAPSQTDILGAVKLSGKTTGGWSLGTLAAVTGREQARFLDTAGALRRATVEPRAGYAVARLTRDLRDGNTVLGIAGTAAHRDLADGFAPTLARSALAGGISAEHAWQRRTWTASGYASRSRVSGSTAYIASLQRSNTHSLQRPDRERSPFDGTRESLQGHFYSLSLAKTSGRHWRGSLTYEETAPGFDVNELGFQRRSDLRAFGGAVLYRETAPTRLFRNWGLILNGTRSTNFDGDVIERRITTIFFSQWSNFWEFNIVAGLSPGSIDDRLTRGGPLALRPRSGFSEISLSTDERRRASYSFDYGYSGNAAGEWSHSLDAGVDLRPSSALQLSIGAEYTRRYDHDQFVTAVVDQLAQATFGRRYVFGDLEQHELGIESRVEWTFSPKLSLQVFAQPFVSAGRVDRYKEFQRPRTFDFAVYGQERGTITRDPVRERVTIDPDGAGPAGAFQFSERDFTVRALRGNAVLRWEYRPGSTIYVVWQQLREREVSVADLSAARRPSDAFKAPAHNVLLLKASYWFGR